MLLKHTNTQIMGSDPSLGLDMCSCSVFDYPVKERPCIGRNERQINPIKLLRNSFSFRMYSESCLMCDV
jgi:hypothetical protein